jgi:23S rRNA (uracil1939-C5)-methyltransferase
MFIELEQMTPSGECIGRVDGLAVFVAQALPGEQAEIEVIHRRRSFARARITHLLRPSPDRVAAPCPHFGVCGGCDWQHIRYEAQVRFKTAIVREQLARIGGLVHAEVRECIASPLPYAYRNRIQLVASANGRLGYRARNSHDVIEVEACPIAGPQLNALIAEAHDAAHPGATVDLRTDSVDARARLPSHDGAPDERKLRFALHGEHYNVSDDSFFQVNTHVADTLIAEVLKALAPLSDAHVLDLYCGVGLFTVPLARQGQRVVGVEVSASAVADARANTAIFGQRVTIVQADVAAALNRCSIREHAWDAVVLDPPRAGMKKEALDALISLNAPRIVYVSCDPATLARDARLLCNGGYALAYAQPLDMFPQTRHVETVAVFMRA